MYKFKNSAKRVVELSAAVGLLFSIAFTALAPTLASADPLNPLTQRTLLLSSSSPGWAFTDGAGDGTYAPPGSGPNGQKTGETFTFNTSTGGVALKAFTFQYCVTAAGECLSPGDDASPPTDTSSTSDFNVAGSWSEGSAAGDFEVYTNSSTDGIAADGTYSASSGWTMTESNVEDHASPTGANNFITLTNSTGITPIANEPLKVVFKPSASAYITNPGSSAFFVKINDYNSNKYQNFADNYPNAPVTVTGTPDTYTCGTLTGSLTDDCPDNVVDGGVTVANVMNQSIEIQTKVLETMEFSVGTVDPDAITTTDLGHAHGQCDPILGVDPTTPAATNPTFDTLLLGDPSAEYSLSPTSAYGTSSLWRLSTNSANGATVYYTGNTLADTEGNEIAPMTDSPTANDSAFALAGSEQFGLGLNYISQIDTNIPAPDTPVTDTDTVPYFSSLDSGFVSDVAAQYTGDTQDKNYWYSPTLSPLVPTPSYGSAVGAVSGAFGSGSGSDPKFAFNSSANTTPVPIASENTSVVDCSTGQVNYVADIAPSTPADVYTTKINYLASPEY